MKGEQKKITTNELIDFLQDQSSDKDKVLYGILRDRVNDKPIETKNEDSKKTIIISRICNNDENKKNCKWCNRWGDCINPDVVGNWGVCSSVDKWSKFEKKK